LPASKRAAADSGTAVYLVTSILDLPERGAHATKACWRQPLASSNLASEYRSLGVWLDLYGSFGPCDGGDCPLALIQIDRLSKSSLGRTATAE